MLLGLVAIVLIGLGALFTIASAAKTYRLAIGIPLLLAGIAISAYLLKPKPQIVELKVSWDPSGRIAVEELKCPYCGASLPAPEPAQEYIKCGYCGKTIKLVEEPRW